MKVNFEIDQLLKLSEAENNAVVINDVVYTWTGASTGRSPKAKRIECDDFTINTIDWNNNSWIETRAFDRYWRQFEEYFHKNSDKIYLQTVQAVRDPRRSLYVNVYAENPQHALFADNMFVSRHESVGLGDGYEVYHFPSLLDEPTVLISFSKKKILISGTLYSGEIKKSVFTVLNYHFPTNGELPMHCSVNIDKDRKNPAVFFGLSGTGKTTLSSDSNRILIGDDEHAWTSDGLTNFEGGCYAKTFNLSKEDEPEIWNACFAAGTIIENVLLNNEVPDFNSSVFTENGRASYSIESIPNADKDGWVDEHPKNIIMLTCDAFGVLPPVSKLSADEAVEQFSLGYTAKVAGTEDGITEPIATFSPCFGAPFMPLPTEAYANLLKEKVEKHGAQCWLVNTGWTGGPYGIGERISIKTTRMIIDSILDGTLATQPTVFHDKTNMTIPVHKKISLDILIPENTWEDKEKYEQSLFELLELFKAQKSKN